MRSGARALAALLMVGAAASYGLVAVESASAVPAPSGGCWTYVPGPGGLDSPPASNISTALEPWTTVADGGFSLGTTGGTAVGSTRTATATITSGPVISPAAVAGTASFVLSVDGEPLAEPVVVDFEAAGGQPVEDLVASVPLPVEAAGAHTVRLDAIYFDVSDKTRRVACNGQDSGAVAGPNPATDPLPTDIETDFTAVASASATITKVVDQSVLTAARPGDVVTAQLGGLASSVPATLQLCATAGACGAVGEVLTDPSGAATATFTVPGSAPVGAGTLQVDDGASQVSAELAVLGVQVVTAAEKLDTASTIVTLTGTGWDPKRDVTIRGFAGTDSSTDRTTDDEVVAEVDATGAFTAEYVVADEATESVIVDQARSDTNIGAVYLISGVIGGAAADGEPDDGTADPQGDTASPGSTSSGSSTGSSSGTGTTTPLVPPADIPLPQDIPVAVPPPAGATPADVPADLAVTEERLDGQATLGELFGGSPQRDLIFLVENMGEETVEDPVVRVSVGRSEEVEPQLVDAAIGTLAPGEQAVVTVPLELPMAAFGEYHVVGQVGDTEVGAFELEWTTYPWGLFALNALALVLLAWGIHRRLALRRTTTAAALAVPGDGDAVVDLEAAGAWWAYRGGTGPRPAARTASVPTTGAAVPVAPAPPRSDDPQPGEAVVDLEAAENWWQRSGRGRPHAS